uniref:Cation/H+ exchanger transmembrane domain-containing protein n=1 Tax=Strigamia maritima TaxID=126957 RepID=T1JLY6_STRMM
MSRAERISPANFWYSLGPTLYGLSVAGAMGNVDLGGVEALVFSALISAVDPVAVLAIFQEVGVLFNCLDAVTVVIYTMMVAFTTMKPITADQVGLGIAAFFCVSVGGLCIGIIFGILTALITKFTEEVRVVEPLALLGMAYMSYLMAEMVHFSGIISIIGCGLVQAQYAVANISSKSYTTVKYFSKMLRYAQLAYGGLRGAVCFSLVIMLDENVIPNKQMFVTTTLVVILFTVFIQGGTIKPLVKWLEIQSHKEEHLSLTSEINGTLIDQVMAGIEEIAGERGENYIKLLIYRYDEKYLKKWLQRSTTDGSNLFKVYEKIAIQDHYAHLYGASGTDDEKKIIRQNSFDPDQDELHLQIKKPVPIEPIPKKQPSKKKSTKASMKGPSCPFAPSIFDNAVKPKGKVSMIAQTLVGVGQTVASPLLMDSMQAAVTLRRALRDNYYNKFHQKYNPNLIRDDEQELGEQLRMRRLRARRLTMAALSPTTSNQSSRTDLSQIAEESSEAMGRTGHGDRSRSQSLANPSDLLVEKARQRRKQTMGKAQTTDDANLSQGAADASAVPLHPQLVALRSNGSVSSVDSERSSGSRSSMGDLEMKSAPLDTITESENDHDDQNGDQKDEQQPFLEDEDSVFGSPNQRRRQRQLAKEHKVDVDEEEPETVV